jgi:hypothetical protein
MDLKRDCVRHGSPIIILTMDGFVYFPISANMPDSGQRKKMMPFVGKYVQATGAVFDRKGTRANRNHADPGAKERSFEHHQR